MPSPSHRVVVVPPGVVAMPVMDRQQWLEIQPLLDEVLELPDDSREQWLVELSTTSPQIAEQIRLLLSSESRADQAGFLVAGRTEPTLEGTELGAYTIERPLGQGGMGSVWLARRTDGRYEGLAAVKILNLSLLSARGQERFRREGSMLARLTHPGIARLLDAGVSPTGQPYLVLEHVDGQRIDRYAEEHALSLENRVRLFRQVLAAVAHAHANLIVHRDLKPSNILVTSGGVVKLLDFGIAKLLDSDERNDPASLTIEGSRLLTPEFATPEQVRGDQITTATDVYALGVLLYVLLSGRHPTAEGRRTPADVLSAVLEVHPQRLGVGDLDSVLAKALRVPPDERYQSVAALDEDIERFLNHVPVRARPDTVLYRARKFLRRNRAALGVAAGVGLTLIAATGFSIAQMRNAREQRDSAVRDAMRARAMSDVQSVLAGDSRGPSGRPLSTPERLALAERVLTLAYRDTPWLVAEVMADLSGRYYELLDRVQERAMLARARAIARDADAPLAIATADCRRVYSFAFDDMIDSARIDLAEAKQALQRSRVPADPELKAACLSAEGKLLVTTNQSDSAVALLRQSVALSEGFAGTSRLTRLNDLGEVLRLSGHAREAIPYQREVVTSLEQGGYVGTDQYPNALTFLHISLVESGELATDDSLLHAVLQRYEAEGGAANVPPLVSLLYAQLKASYGAWDTVGVWFNRVMQSELINEGWEQTWIVPVRTQLYLRTGRIADAERVGRKLPATARGQRATAAWLRAELLRARGHGAEAARLLEGELHTLSTDGQRPQYQFAIPFVTASEWRLARGDARGADSLASLAIGVVAPDSISRTHSAYAGRGELARARAKRALGDLRGAIDAATRASHVLAAGYGPDNAWVAQARALNDSLATQLQR